MKTHNVMRKFRHARLLRDDCYVADYTEQSHSRRGVSMSGEPFDDIDAFHLRQGRRPVEYVAVNLEEHKAWVRGIANCECFFVSSARVERPWLLFLELKYCKAKNVGGHASKAISQMAAVLRKLADERVLDPDDYRIYFNYSSPANRRRQPFTAFMHTPADALDIVERYNAWFLGFNELVIASPQHIRSPKIRI